MTKTDQNTAIQEALSVARSKGYHQGELQGYIGFLKLIAESLSEIRAMKTRGISNAAIDQHFRRKLVGGL